MKYCPRCKRTLSHDQFYKNNAAHDKMDGMCKECKKAHMKGVTRRRTQRENIPIPDTKFCPRCKLEKPSVEFNRKKSNADGLYGCCRVCHNRDRQAKRAALAARETINLPDQKKCLTCKELKDASEFASDRSNTDGLLSRCKSCHNAAVVAHRQGLAARNHIPIPDFKVCPQCGIEQPSDQFHGNRVSPDGLAPYCRICSSMVAALRYARDPDPTRARVAEYQRQHPDVNKISGMRRRALKKASNGVITREKLDELRNEPYCYYCGRAFDDRPDETRDPRHEFTIDHFYPLAGGGADEDDNLVAACRSCNSSKLDRDPHAFMQSMMVTA